jgi:predicted ATP-grasp superfamily ATP-dependent carboligase
VAVTGRALAASAARGGYPVVVLDCFGDRDTLAVAREAVAVAKPGTMHLDVAATLRQAGNLAPAAHCAGLVVGSGFERGGTFLSKLAAGRKLMGNPPRVIATVKDPRSLFPLLDRLGIPHPAVRLTPPANPAGWLAKRAGGAGGTHVVEAGLVRRGRDRYFQRFETGRACSVLFLCDGTRASVVGFNEQWTRRVGSGRPFVYAGAIGRLALPDAVEHDIRARLDGLVSATGLVGLAGLDFLWRDEEWLALEVNPRPTATLDLYDADHPRGLFHAHLRACAGELPAGEVPGSMVRAQLIVPAEERWSVVEGFIFPPWCRDLPREGQQFHAGDPVCTVLAEGANHTAVVALLESRRTELQRMMSEVPAPG